MKMIYCRTTNVQFAVYWPLSVPEAILFVAFRTLPKILRGALKQTKRVRSIFFEDLKILTFDFGRTWFDALSKNKLLVVAGN